METKFMRKEIAYTFPFSIYVLCVMMIYRAIAKWRSSIVRDKQENVIWKKVEKTPRAFSNFLIYYAINKFPIK